MLLVGSTSLHLFGQLLVVDSGAWPARFLFGAILLAVMSSHGDAFRVTLDASYMALASTGLVAIPLFRCESRDVLLFVVMTHVAGLFMMFAVGIGRHKADAQQEYHAQQEAALSASLLALTNSRAARLEQQLTVTLGAHHDGRNLLSAALLKSDLLHRKLEKEEQPVPSSELKATLRSVRDALQLASSVFTASLRPSEAGESFTALLVLEKHVADFARRRPGLYLHLVVSEDAVLELPGGDTTLRRIIDNVLLNAAEGDGKQCARNAWIEACLEAGEFHVRISDDGPGFPVNVLTSARQRFTTKNEGSGLGLITVDSLVRAGGGTLQLSNRAEGGAQVDVFLPVAQQRRPLMDEQGAA